MTIREWFDEQDPAYRESVLPPAVRARVSVEAAVSMGWRDLVGDAGRTVSLDEQYEAILEIVFRGLLSDSERDAFRLPVSDRRGRE